MQSDHNFLLTGALAIGLVLSGCSKKEDAAAVPAAPPTDQAAAPAASSPAAQPSSPAPRPQVESERNPQLEDLRLQVDAYEKVYKRKPASLQQMVQEGFMNAIPPAPPGKRFDYDPATARVSLVSQ